MHLRQFSGGITLGYLWRKGYHKIGYELTYGIIYLDGNSSCRIQCHSKEYVDEQIHPTAIELVGTLRQKVPTGESCHLSQ